MCIGDRRSFDPSFLKLYAIRIGCIIPGSDLEYLHLPPTLNGIRASSLSNLLS